MAVAPPLSPEPVMLAKAEDAELARTLREKGHYAESAQLPLVLTTCPRLRGAAASKGLPTSMPRISCQPVCIQEEIPTQAAVHLPAAPGTKYIMILRAAPR
eukprot:4348903-Pyramimonas_sp.AAC.1